MPNKPYVPPPLATSTLPLINIVLLVFLMATRGRPEPRLTQQQLRPDFDLLLALVLCFQASPALICWETLAATTGWGTFTSSSCTTCCSQASPPPPSSRRSPGRYSGSSSVPSVSLYHHHHHFTECTISCKCVQFWSHFGVAVS